MGRHFVFLPPKPPKRDKPKPEEPKATVAESPTKVLPQRRELDNPQIEYPKGTPAQSRAEILYQQPPGFVPHSESSEIDTESPKRPDLAVELLQAINEHETRKTIKEFKNSLEKSSAKPPSPSDTREEKQSLRGLEAKEIVGLLGMFFGLVLVFFLGAPTAAGVIDMTLARILLVVGWAGAVVAAFVIERLSFRSRRRIVITTVLTAIVVGFIALYSNRWIGRKKAEQDRMATPTSTPTPADVGLRPSPSPTLTPPAMPHKRTKSEQERRDEKARKALNLRDEN